MMLIPWVPLAWSLIQVTVIASTALLFAWALRGRVPQVASAVLSGVCIASLLLTLIAWIPPTQWSLVPFASIALDDADPVSSVDSSTGSNSPSEEGTLVNGSNLNSSEEGSFQSESRNSIDPLLEEGGFESIGISNRTIVPSLFRKWFTQKIQSMEVQMRSIENRSAVSPTLWSAGNVGFLIAGLLFTGLLLTGILWLYGFAYVRWIIGRSELVSDPALEEIVNRFSKRLQMRWKPEIRVSAQIPIGATVGWKRCILLVHPSWKTWSDTELQAVLVHELAHAARWDFIWVIAGGLIRVIFFFHPIIHLLVRRLRLEQELAADQLAAGLMGSARAYGRALASLTLRCEQPLRTPSPMLAAGHICIVRRIAMLKHGSLKANRRSWRWAGSISVATVLCVVPFSGLRGMMQEKPKEIEAKREQVETKDPSDKDEEKAKRIAAEAERRAANEKYPPLSFEGPMVVRPGRIKNQSKGGHLSWISDYASVSMLGRSLPEGAEIHGTGFHKTEWTDLGRNHGTMSEGFSIKHGDQVMPGVLSEFFKSPLFQYREVAARNEIESRKVVGLGRITYDVEAGTHEDRVEAESWFIDDEKGFFHGKIDEVEEYVHGMYDPLASIPPKYLSEFRTAALAHVFPDCKEWKKRMIDFASGSPKGAEFALAVPLLDGLEEYGYFFYPDREQNLILRATYRDSDRANAGQSVLQGLVALGMNALQSDPREPEIEYYRGILESLKVEQFDRELRITVNAIPQSNLIESIFPALFHVVPGWESLGTARVELKPEHDHATLQGESYLAISPHVAQSILADNYRGKQVRLQAEIACPKDAQADAGLFLLTSDAQQETLTHFSRSIDGTSDILSAMKWDADIENRKVEENHWSPVSIELNVPSDSHALTFGAYFFNTDLRIRNLKLTVVGDANPKCPTSLPFSNRNLFVIPGLALQASPSNMDFKLPKVEITQEAITKSAKVPDGDAKVAR